MANDCFGTIKFVAKSEDVLDKIKDIFNYKDSDFCLYRVFDFSDCERTEEDGFKVMIADFDVAWSASLWINTDDNPEEKVLLEWHPEDETKNVYGTAHITNLPHICRELDCAFELYSREPGCCFAEHYAGNHNGELMCNETEKYTERWHDEDGNELDAPIEEGGFGDDYCKFSSAGALWG